MSFGFGGLMELDLLIKAQDAASDVIRGIGDALESVISITANFDTTLTQVQNNTTMTAADVDVMRQAVLALNSQTGAPLDALAQGFMHIENLGFSAADAVKVLTEANKSAVSTGSDTAAVAETLALQMHEFGASANDAAKYMNVLHLAAAEGNSTLEQFVEQTSKSVAMAANLGIPITQVDAALAALSRHMDLSQANTALAGELSKLANPAAATVKELQHLSDVTGVKGLAQDFTAAGLQAKGFPAVMDDLKRATGGNVTEMLRLIPAMRGGLAEMVLLGTGSADYTKVLNDLNATMAGKTDPTTQAFSRTMATFNQQLAVVMADVQQFAITVGQPILDALQGEMRQLIDYLNTHKADVTAFGHALGTDIGDVVKGLVTDIPKMWAALEAGWTDLQKIGAFFDGLGNTVDRALITAATAFFNLGKGIEDAFLGAFNVIAEGINKLVEKLPPEMRVTLGLTGSLPLTPVPNASQLATERNQFLASQFGAQDPNLYQPGRQGGGGFGSELALAVAQHRGAGGQRIVDAAYDTSVGSGGSGRQGGTGQGADATDYQTAQQAAQAIQAALTQARDQFRYDQTQGAEAPVLLGDIKAILSAMRDAGQTQLARDLERQQDMKTLIAAVQTQAQQRFQTDLQNDAPRARLLADINALNTNLRAIGAPAQDLASGIGRQLMTQLGQQEQQHAQTRLELDRLRGVPDATIQRDIAAVLRGMKDAFATPDQIALQRLQLEGQTKPPPLPTYPAITYQRPSEAGYQQTIAAFGLPGRDHMAEMVTLLRQQLAAAERRAVRDEQQIALLQQQLAALQQGTQAAAVTAGNTGRLVALAAQPTPTYRDPRKAAGLAHP